MTLARRDLTYARSPPWAESPGRSQSPGERERPDPFAHGSTRDGPPERMDTRGCNALSVLSLSRRRPRSRTPAGQSGQVEPPYDKNHDLTRLDMLPIRGSGGRA